MQNGIMLDRYDFLCGSDSSIIKIALNNDDYHTIRIQSESAKVIDFTGGVKNLNEVIINRCLHFTRVFWPENVGSIRRLKIGNCPELTTLDLTTLTSLEELNIVDCHQLGEIKILSEQLRFINIQGCLLDNLDIQKSLKIESLILSTSCSHLHLPLANRHALRVAIINLGDTIKNEKRANNHPNEIQKINWLECDFSDCTQLDNLFIKSLNSPAIINLTGCAKLETPIFSFQQKAEIIGYSSHPANEKKSIQQFEQIEKHRFANKKYAIKMPVNPDDTETVVQENGALRKKNKACVVKINLLMGPKPENVIYQNSLYKFLNRKNEIINTRYNRLHLTSNITWQKESFTREQWQLPTQKYNRFIPVKNYREQIIATKKPIQARAAFISKNFAKTFLVAPIQYLIKLNAFKPFVQNIKKKNSILPARLHDKKLELFRIWRQTKYLAPMQYHNEETGNTKQLGERDALKDTPAHLAVCITPEKHYFFDRDKQQNPNLAAINFYNYLGRSSAVTDKQPLAASNPFKENPSLIFDSGQDASLTAINLSQDKDNVPAAPDKQSLAYGSLSCDYPSLISDSEQNGNLAAMNISEYNPKPLAAAEKTSVAEHNMLKENLSLSFDSKQDSNLVAMNISENLDRLLATAEKTVFADGSMLKENPSLISDSEQDSNLAAINISENLLEESPALHGFLNIDTEEKEKSIGIENKKIKLLLSKQLASLHLSELSSTLAAKHSHKINDLSNNISQVLKNFNEFFSLINSDYKNSHKNSVTLFIKNKKNASSHHFLTIASAFNEAMQVLRQILSNYSLDAEQTQYLAKNQKNDLMDNPDKTSLSLYSLLAPTPKLCPQDTSTNYAKIDTDNQNKRGT